MSGSNVIGVIVTHGRLAEAIVQTAGGIVGDFDDCIAISNKSKAPADLRGELQRLIDSKPDANFVIFVDFLGGSCSQACLTLESRPGRLAVVSGVNLPMFLAFLNKRREVEFGKLADEIIDRGTNSIKVLDPSKL